MITISSGSNNGQSQMENLTYHNQLLLRGTINNGKQFELIKNLILTGLCTTESVDLFMGLYSSREYTENENKHFLDLIEVNVLNDKTKSDLNKILNKS